MEAERGDPHEHGAEHVRGDHRLGHPGGVLHVAERALGDDGADEHAPAPDGARVGVAARSPGAARPATTSEEHPHRGAVDARDGHHRERQAVGRLVAAVRPAAGDERAGERARARPAPPAPSAPRCSAGRGDRRRRRPPSGSPALWWRITRVGHEHGRQEVVAGHRDRRHVQRPRPARRAAPGRTPRPRGPTPTG